MANAWMQASPSVSANTCSVSVVGTSPRRRTRAASLVERLVLDALDALDHRVDLADVRPEPGLVWHATTQWRLDPRRRTFTIVTSTAKKVLEAALALPTDVREELVGALSISLRAKYGCWPGFAS
jgi:hypothetical protein